MDGITVAVTGASGFLGSAVAEVLGSRGAQVRALVRSEGIPGSFRGDLTENGWPAEAFEGADVLVHCAAALGGPLHHQRRLNRDGTELVARQAARAGVPRLVHISSVAVYGYRGTYFPETLPLNPSSQAYSTTKAEAEVAARREFPGVTIIRPGGIFGPGARFWSANVVKRAKRRLAFNIGRGDGTLPVVFVDDVADLVATTSTHPAAIGESFNCCLDPAPTWREYQRAYGNLVGSGGWIPLPVSLAKLSAAVVSKLGSEGSTRSVIDELLRYALRQKQFPMDKARSLLGWEPRFDLEGAVAATAPWLRAQGLI
ncbi:MAG: NAD(P)-dependent oxidoreductase [Acidimicrobiia bacterium]|nr:NAD(P)-dependent oxidoreductase [Acidimicrobiia bacterium]